MFAGGGSATVDFVIGADGIHSVIRAALVRGRSAVVLGDRCLPGAAAGGQGRRAADTQHLDEVVGAGSRASPGALPHRPAGRPGERGGGGSRAVAHRVLDGQGEGVGSRRGLRRTSTRPFPSWSGAVEEVYKFAIYDRPPLAEWTVGPGEPAGRREPSDGAVHGPGGRDGHRGRRDPGRCLRAATGRDVSAPCCGTATPGGNGRAACSPARAPTPPVPGAAASGCTVTTLTGAVVRACVIVARRTPPGPGRHAPIAARPRRPFCRPGPVITPTPARSRRRRRRPAPGPGHLLGDGVKTSLMQASCAGWIAVRARKPSRSRRFGAGAQRPEVREVDRGRADRGRDPGGRARDDELQPQRTEDLRIGTDIDA